MQPPRPQLGPNILRLILPLGLALLALGLFLTTRRLDAYNHSPYPLPPIARFAERATLPTATSSLLDRVRVPVEYTLLRGETVIEVFQKLGLAGGEARQATDALAAHVNLRSIKAGNRYSAFFNPDSTLASFELTLAGSGRVELVREGGEWATDWQPFRRTVEVRSVRGDVIGSLEASVRRAGGPPELAYRMADVMQWDVDFTRDLQPGDQFEALYEEVRMEGEYHALGTILALSYIDSDGRRHEAYRYGNDGIYYDGEGRPLKKMFLRSPLRYSRITSFFSMHRFHPVLKCFRPHYGVDYGAPVGTPVQVTANGVVSFAGWDRGGGNVVKVQHPGGYMTAYLHLSRFAGGVRPGARVRQGDIIAFTGCTGLASGPHLDYRVKRGDTWIDPLSIKGVRDEPIPAYRLAAFRSWRDDLRVSMATGRVSRSIASPGEPAAETRVAVNDARPQRPGRAGRTVAR